MNTPTKMLKYLSIGFLIVTFSSCYYDELPDENLIPLPSQVSFATSVQPIFNQNCVACHSGNQAPDLRSANSFTQLMNGYVVPGNPENSILYKSLIGQGAPLMPPNGAINQSKINLVKQWISEGALNN